MITPAVGARRPLRVRLMTVVALTSCVIGGACGACGARPEAPAVQQTSASAEASASTGPTQDPESIERLRRERDQSLRRAAASQKAEQPQRTAGSTVNSTARKSFAAMSSRLGGSVGVAYVPVGSGGAVTRYGSLTTGVGWSTMKVPVAIAVVRSAGGHPSADDRRQLRRAITHSDNAAAMRLWSRLGSGKEAAAKTQRVLRDSGDTSTVVPAKRRRADFTPFGQSEVSLRAQATFAASLPCVSGSGPVLKLMGQVTPSQRWGVGRLKETVAFKGGWGPGADGRYLVRQVAILRLANGTRVGVALAAKPADGRFETGIADLDALARWAERHVHAKREAGC